MDSIKIRKGESLRFNSELDFDEMYYSAVIYQQKNKKWIKARNLKRPPPAWMVHIPDKITLEQRITNIAEYTSGKIFKFYPELSIGS